MGGDLLPAPSHLPKADSGSCGFRSHSQRRDRESFALSSLDPEPSYVACTLGEHSESVKVKFVVIRELAA